MKFRQLGIVMMIGGFLTGHLLATMMTRAGMEGVHLAAGAADPSELASRTARALTFTMWGDIIALIGLVIYFYGVLTSRGGRATVVTGHPV